MLTDLQTDKCFHFVIRKVGGGRDIKCQIWRRQSEANFLKWKKDLRYPSLFISIQIRYTLNFKSYLNVKIFTSFSDIKTLKIYQNTLYILRFSIKPIFFSPSLRVHGILNWTIFTFPLKETRFNVRVVYFDLISQRPHWEKQLTCHTKGYQRLSPKTLIGFFSGVKSFTSSVMTNVIPQIHASNSVTVMKPISFTIFKPLV